MQTCAHQPYALRVVVVIVDDDDDDDDDDVEDDVVDDDDITSFSALDVAEKGLVVEVHSSKSLSLARCNQALDEETRK